MTRTKLDELPTELPGDCPATMQAAVASERWSLFCCRQKFQSDTNRNRRSTLAKPPADRGNPFAHARFTQTDPCGSAGKQTGDRLRQHHALALWRTTKAGAQPMPDNRDKLHNARNLRPATCVSWPSDQPSADASSPLGLTVDLTQQPKIQTSKRLPAPFEASLHHQPV